MGDYFSRVSGDARATTETSPAASKDNQIISSTSERATALRLVVNNGSGYQPITPRLETWVPSLNRLARERIFHHIVSSTLNNPNHPYYSLVSPQLRQDMIDAITSQLTDSHYLA